MSGSTVPAAGEPGNPDAFFARLTPHRSLSRPGFLILMALMGVVSFIGGVAFFVIGAWPVTGFFGLDVLLLYVAFRLNYRAGRQFEILEIRDGVLHLMQVDQKGRVHEGRFNPYWVSVRVHEGPGGRRELALASHGKEHPFGRFLTDDEKEQFAQRLQVALLRQRGARL